MNSKIMILERQQEIHICRGQMIIYKIPLSQIDQVMKPGNIGKHIFHLLTNYKHEDSNLLYDLAKLTHNIVPDNEINWVGTFTIVEQFFDSQKVYQEQVKVSGYKKRYHRKYLGLTRKTRLERDTAENRKSMEILARQNLQANDIPLKHKIG